MKLFNCLRVLAGAATLSLFNVAPAMSDAVVSEASAPITASATVIKPVGLTAVQGDLSDPGRPASRVAVGDGRQPPADGFLAQFPPESSLLVLVEIGGQPMGRFALPEDQFVQPHLAVDGEKLSGVCLLEGKLLLGPIPSGSTDCTVTIICTEN